MHQDQVGVLGAGLVEAVDDELGTGWHETVSANRQSAISSFRASADYHVAHPSPGEPAVPQPPALPLISIATYSVLDSASAGAAVSFVGTYRVSCSGLASTAPSAGLRVAHRISRRCGARVDRAASGRRCPVAAADDTGTSRSSGRSRFPIAA